MRVHKDCKYNRKMIGGSRVCAKTGEPIWDSDGECEKEEVIR